MDSGSVLVSVIVPAHNREQHILNCVTSITKQTYSNLQVIIVDDGSTDKTWQICNELSKEDNRITVMTQENRGPCAARNSGLNLAKGEYICFVDSDDYLDSYFVELLLKAMVDNGVYVASCIYADIRSKDYAAEQEELKVEFFDDLETYFITIAYLQYYQNLSTCACLFHRSLFSELRFDESSKYALDISPFPELIYKARGTGFATVNQVLYYRLVHDSNISQNPYVIGYPEYEYGFKAAMDFWSDKETPEIYNYYRTVYFRFCINRWVPANIMYRQDKTDERKTAIDNIHEATSKMSVDCLHEFTLSNIWGDVWDKISQAGDCVIYGYGNNGKEFVYPWLKHFKVPVVEIWDRVSQGNDNVDGIQIKKAHKNMNKSTPVLITIDSEYDASLVRNQLREFGYTIFFNQTQLRNAIKWAIYNEHMPFLLI